MSYLTNYVLYISLNLYLVQYFVQYLPGTMIAFTIWKYIKDVPEMDSTSAQLNILVHAE